MKRRDLIRQLEQAGCIFVRPGGKHDVYKNPATGAWSTVPRHTEIKEGLARKIKKELGLKD